MEIKQVRESLLQVFNEEKKRVVFWYDGEREFEETLPSLQLGDGISIVRLDEVGALALKIKLEIEDPEGRYLVYSPRPEPQPQDDWLLDIRLYGRTFHADKASIVLNELGLVQQSLRPYLMRRKKFCQNKERLNRLKKWVNPEDGETELDLKMLAVIVRAEQPEVFAVLMKLFSDSVDALTASAPDPAPGTWEETARLELEEVFWDLMSRTFGYAAALPSLSDLLIRLLVTDFAQALRGDLPAGLSHFLLTDAHKALNASVFLSQWRSHMAHFQSYDRLSRHFGKQLQMDDHLRGMDLPSLKEVMTFAAAEQRIIRILRDDIAAGDLQAFAAAREIIQRRCDGHWANTLPGESTHANLYRAAYEALVIAADLLTLRQGYGAGLSYPSPEAMFQAYTRELYRFDQYYRKFHVAADQVELGGWDILKGLREVIEQCYGGWFLDQLAVTWDAFLHQGDGRDLLWHWRIAEVWSQTDFFRNAVEPVLRTSPKNRVFVLISDAFRFAAAEDLAREINGKYRFEAHLKPMLGVVPSCTPLGMAALLPHGRMAFKEDGKGEVLVDAEPAASLEQRSKILSGRQGIAVKAEDLLAMTKDQGREFIKPYRVVYIYHNRVDATGDKAASETQTFEAVGKCIEELEGLASFIINSLNGTLVLITADHGFIYRDKPPAAIDKSELEIKPAVTLTTNKRYILGKDLGESPKAWHGHTRNTGGTDDDVEFWLPKGTNRFYFTGGARFFHGGAMLQEVVIPLIEVRELKGKHAAKSQVRKVGVSLLGATRKIVNNIHRFEFIQTDAVSERTQARSLLISLRDGPELISNEEMVTFDSASSSMDERKKSVSLTLKAIPYDSKKEYHLVLRDAESLIEYDRTPVFIDLAFTKDF